MKSKKIKIDPWKTITIVVIALYTLFLIYPVGKLLLQAFFESGTHQFTLDYFTKFFSQSYYFDTLMNSFKVSICATILSLMIGTPLAYFFTLYRIRGKKLLQILIIVASMSAPFIGAYSWVLLLGRNGVILRFFQDVLNIQLPDIYGFGLVTIGEESVIPSDVQIGKNTAISGVTSKEDYINGELASGETLIKVGE